MTQTLSGGMRRRLIIARALLNSPKLLVLDEPTTGLDPQARHLIWQKLSQLKRAGTTMILTTHYMDEAARLCDELVIMDEGVVLDRGAPKDLIDRHVGKDVVEVNLLGKDQQIVLNLSKPYVSEAESVGDHLLLYPHDPSTLIKTLVENNSFEFTHRMATLEDVFLKLTGRELTE
ncbi:MAG TPA: ATP-binding cassette domain-containing protein, partial [Bdellovibrionota bacterium]|nr:ATP-binding cassette domain-containing protein [Bdellovibrionota bacterium]